MDWPAWLNTAAIAAGGALGGALIQAARWWWELRRAKAEKQPDFVIDIVNVPNSTGHHTAVLYCRNNTQLPILIESITGVRPRCLRFYRGITDPSGNLASDEKEVGAKKLTFDWEVTPINQSSKALWSGYLHLFARCETNKRFSSQAAVIVVFRPITSSRRVKRKLKSVRSINWNGLS